MHCLKGEPWRQLEVGRCSVDCNDDDLGLEFSQEECNGGKRTFMSSYDEDYSFPKMYSLFKK